MTKCEKCSENGQYIAQLNRVLCEKHKNELSVKHGLWSESTKVMENLVFDMKNKYQHQLNEKEITEILKTVSQRVFDNEALA